MPLTTITATSIKQVGKPKISKGLIKGFRTPNATDSFYSDRVIAVTEIGDIELDISDGVKMPDGNNFVGTSDALVDALNLVFPKDNSSSVGSGVIGIMSGTPEEVVNLADLNLSRTDLRIVYVSSTNMSYLYKGSIQKQTIVAG